MADTVSSQIAGWSREKPKIFVIQDVNFLAQLEPTSGGAILMVKGRIW